MWRFFFVFAFLGGGTLGTGHHGAPGGHHQQEDHGPQAGGERLYHGGEAGVVLSRDTCAGPGKVQQYGNIDIYIYIRAI